MPRGIRKNRPHDEQDNLASRLVTGNRGGGAGQAGPMGGLTAKKGPSTSRNAGGLLGEFIPATTGGRIPDDVAQWLAQEFCRRAFGQ
jgi:hypothetical protein